MAWRFVHPSAPLHPGHMPGSAYTDHRDDYFCPSHRADLLHSHFLSSSHIDPIQSQTSSLQAGSRVLNHIFLSHHLPWIISVSSHDAKWGDFAKHVVGLQTSLCLPEASFQAMNMSLECLVLSQEGGKGTHFFFFFFLFPLQKSKKSQICHRWFQANIDIRFQV